MVTQLDEFVDFVTDLVEPQKRADLNLKRWHKTPLLGTKIKTQDQIKKKKTKAKSKQLSRSQLNELGLYTLPTKALKYDDVAPLHDLWLDYIFNHLRMYLTMEEGQPVVPNVYDSNYDAFSKALVKSDFHGALVTVVASCNASVVGQTGIVAMETKNTFKIVGKDNRMRSKCDPDPHKVCRSDSNWNDSIHFPAIPKIESVFRLQIKNIEFTVYGKYLNIRPAERAVKKIKNFMEPDL